METPIKKMKNVFFSLAFMLIGSFAFANNAKQISKINFTEAVELVKTTSNYELVQDDSTLGCLLKFTFILEDGSQVVRYYYVEQSCKEFFDSIQ
jgi:hypothetical protein